MTDLIFVYGSLMSNVPSQAGKWLAQNATRLATDELRGRLYDLGRYPGLLLVTSAQDQNLVRGEVYRMTRPKEALAYLDEYEGVDLPVPEYQRKLCHTQQGYHCWVYELMPGGQEFPLIGSGDYSTYYPTNSRHLAFIQRSDASTSS